jgi:hypothetical protein
VGVGERQGIFAAAVKSRREAMQVPVVLERMSGNGYRATGVEPLGLVAEGASREEALQKLSDLLADKIRSGVEVVLLEVPGANNPWRKAAGIWDKDDPLVQEWRKAIEEYRRKVDEDPDYL